jgi:hypothetical protein
MNRRTFNQLAGMSVVGAVAGSAGIYAQGTSVAMAAQTGTGEEVVLEDKELLVAFDKASGALTRMVRKSTNWVIERRPEQGVSFRLLVPLPKQRANFVLGQKQRAASVQKVSGNRVEIIWKDPVSEHGGVVPLTLTAAVELENGALIFEATLVNDSAMTVETIDYPYFGDINPPAKGEKMEADHMWYGNLVVDEIHPHFNNQKGYWGVNYPTKTIESKESLFCLIQAEKQGLIAKIQDPTQPYLLEFTFEQHPGVVESIDNLIPAQDKLSSYPVHLEFRCCHFLFIQPHSTKKTAPVNMTTYDGDWHAGVDVYKTWRAKWFKQPHIAEWVKDVHSWLQLQIDGAEQDFSIKYRELPRYIDECAANGVTAIQLVGWNIGGQDGGDPCLDTDPGLGTWEELHQAILYARSKGVKMILFGKPIWADRTTEWCKKELYKYAATDPYGIPYEMGGYSYTTPTQLAAINNKRRFILDTQCQAYRDIVTKEFRKIVDLGAAGWLFDEVCWHAGVDYSFSSDHGYPAPGYLYGGDMPLANQFRAVADQADRDFIFAGEGPGDWLMQNYPVSYFRITNGSRPVCRYIDSQAPLMVAATGIDDREMLNLILLNRYIISYEPFNFKGHVTDFPLTLEYGKKIDALRRRYRALLWDAEFRDTLGATVTSDGRHRHSVFVASSGKRTVVVVNQEYSKAITAKMNLPNPGSLMVATPEQPESRPASDTVTIPARSAIVIMEQ